MLWVFGYRFKFQDIIFNFIHLDFLKARSMFYVYYSIISIYIFFEWYKFCVTNRIFCEKFDPADF